MKELREQFEKEKGVSVFWFDSNGQKCANPLYIEWLESKLKERDEIIKLYSHIPYNHNDINPWLNKEERIRLSELLKQQ